MIYQNRELDLNKFFVNRHDQKIVSDRALLKNQKLDCKIYLSASWSPLTTIRGTDSAFVDWWIPSPSYKFSVINDSIKSETLTKNLDFQTYQTQIFDNIRNNLQNIYNQHKNVVLLYSGGIDSVVVLSYLVSMNLLNRTKIICVRNLTQTHVDSLFCNSKKIQKVQGVLELYKNDLLGIEYLDVDEHDIAWAFNHGGIEHIKCYATAKVLRHLKNTAVLMGIHGNQILLHKSTFLDEMIRRDPTRKNEIQNLSARTDLYSHSLQQYDVEDRLINAVPIEHQHFLVKPWHALSGFQGNTIYGPLGSNQMFDLLRQLDFDQVSAKTIFDAELAKKIIDANAPILNQYHAGEGHKDFDNLEEAQVSADLLDKKFLEIPQDLNHNKDGLNYLTDQVAVPKLPINTMVILKSLHWLDSW